MTREELLQIAKPILFNTEMVRAILDGRKTVTRRLVKTQPTYRLTCGQNWEKLLVEAAAPYQPGDILYVRETWFYESHMEDVTAGDPDLPSGRYLHRYIYKADSQDYPVNVGYGATGWRPSIHMPKEAARIFLKVKDVRVERLQDIKNLREEGIIPSESCEHCFAVCGGCEPKNSPTGCDNEVVNFADIWDSTIKKSDLDRYGWDANPWVWVIEFERIETK